MTCKLTSPGIFHVLGMDVVTGFDTLFVSGAIDEQKQTADPDGFYKPF
ncbi:MAG: hypothetical protein IPN60_00010 [Saprospiraceae bacterium]|nr:hypothetical protein [Candidatus Opimibacter skivensis]